MLALLRLLLPAYLTPRAWGRSLLSSSGMAPRYLIFAIDAPPLVVRNHYQPSPKPESVR